MIPELEQNIEKIKIIIGAILSQCDGAKQIDGVGFNKFDSFYMRDFLYNYDPSLNATISAYEGLRKYRRQLENKGIYELYSSINFDSKALKERFLEECKINLINAIDSKEGKFVAKVGKDVKTIDITSNNKWIWDLYNHPSIGKDWFKANGMYVKKDTYLNRDVWQVVKWVDSDKKIEPKIQSRFGLPIISQDLLVKPSSIQLNYSDKLLAYQVDHVKFLLASLINFNAVLDASDTGCHKKGTEILMFDGSKKKVEDIVVGDVVMGWQGTPQTVTELKRGREQMFEIKPVKGDSFIVNKNHILTLIQNDSSVIDIKLSDYILLDHLENNYLGFRRYYNSFIEFLYEERFSFSVLPLEEDDYYGFSLDGDGRFLLGDFTVTHNTGKTFSALACARELNRIPIIITPKSVIPSWERACKKHFEFPEYKIYNYESIKNNKYPICVRNENDTYIWNLDSEKYILIFDEVHRCKNRDTLNSRMLVGAKSCNIKTICLSATIADNPSQMYAIGVTLGLFANNFYNTWLRSLGGFFNSDEMRYEFGEESLLRVNSEIFPLKGHRISIKELGDQFPETSILPDVFTISEASQKRINDLYSIINEALYSLRQKEKKDVGHHLTDMLRARQEIEIVKVPIFLELVQDAIEENNSVVIIVNFKETLNALATKLNTKCVVHGDQTAEERERNIADFQADKERIIILNIRSGGVGVSLHDLNGNYPRVSLISPSWSAQDIVQAVGRVWRAGSKSASLQKIVYCANTIEEEICDRMKYKIDNISKINEAVVSEVFASLGEEAEWV